MGGAKYFTTSDLQSGYWQVALDEKSKEITAFSTTRGHWKFNVMPFGLSNAPATFQRLMDFVLIGLHWSHCLVYLDDVIIFGKTFDEHQERLQIVLTRISLRRKNLKDTQCPLAIRLSFAISGEEISIIEHTKYLGAQVDQYMN